MNHQNQNHYETLTTAPYTVFKKIDNNTFIVNSSCILATKKVITNGNEYLLADYSSGTNVKITNVLLADCYYRNGIIHLIVRDIRSQIESTLDHGIEYPENDCTWLLIDMDYFKERENIKAIQNYCDCDTDSKNRGNSEVSHKLNYDNNLLDFDF